VYDLVVGADGAPIESDTDLVRHAAGRAPGTVTELRVIREGATHIIPVKLSERGLPPPGVRGADEVDQAGPARAARLRAGQVVLEVNRRRIVTVADYQAAVGRISPGAATALLVFDPLSGQRRLYTVVADLPR
jgi:S1-C subfamily serine protease